MWNRIKFLAILVGLVFFLGCAEEPEPQGVPTGVEVVYPVYSEDLQILGNLTVQQLDNGSLDVIVNLNSGASDDLQVALVENNAIDGFTVNSVFGTISTGATSAQFDRPEGNNIGFNQFISYD